MQERFISHIRVDSFGYSLLRESGRGGRERRREGGWSEAKRSPAGFSIIGFCQEHRGVEQLKITTATGAAVQKKREMSGSLILQLLFTVLKHSAAPFGVSRSRLMTALFGSGGCGGVGVGRGWGGLHCEDKR